MCKENGLGSAGVPDETPQQRLAQFRVVGVTEEKMLVAGTDERVWGIRYTVHWRGGAIAGGTVWGRAGYQTLGLHVLGLFTGMNPGECASRFFADWLVRRAPQGGWEISGSQVWNWLVAVGLEDDLAFDEDYE